MEVLDTLRPELRRIRAELDKLKGITIHVGIQGIPGANEFQKGVYGSEADLLTIARVHEYGAKIHVQHAKNLTIPIHKLSYGKHVRDFPGLFYIKTEEGVEYGVTMKSGRNDKENHNNLNFLFLCIPAVTIPERSYIRAGFDHGKERITAACEKALTGIIRENWDAQQAAEYIGGQSVAVIHQYMSDASHFTPKGKIQRDAAPSWADSPLVVSKRLFNSISYTLEGAES